MLRINYLTNNVFISFSQAAEEAKPASSFNPFLTEDSDPPLLLDIDADPAPKPIHNVLSYFQKDYHVSETSLKNSNTCSNSINKNDVAWLILLTILGQFEESKYLFDNNKSYVPSVFSATDGLPFLVSHIDGYSEQVEGESYVFFCTVFVLDFSYISMLSFDQNIFVLFLFIFF